MIVFRCDNTFSMISRLGRAALACVLAVGIWGTGSSPVHAKDFTVNSGSDRPDQTLNGTCDTGQTVNGQPECTIRAAIQEANNVSGQDEISFDGLSSGATIFVDTGGNGDLPAITDPVDILGSTAPDTPLSSSPPSIILTEGSGVSTGLTIGPGGAGSYIDRIAVLNFPDSGIEIRAKDVEVWNSFLGIDPGSMSAEGNGTGLTLLEERALISENVISGNTDYGLKLGNTSVIASGLITDNIIGLSDDATTAVANGDGETSDAGIYSVGSDGATVENNEVAGNDGQGFRIEGVSLTIKDNYIGTNRNYDTGLGNQFDGVRSTWSSLVVDENLVVDNGGAGISVRSGTVVTDNYVGIANQYNGPLTPIGNRGTGIVVDGSEGEITGVDIGGDTGTGDGSVGGVSTPEGTGNVIGANGGGGILVTAKANGISIRENYIGTTPGDDDFGNGGVGVRIVGNGEASTMHTVGVDETETLGSGSNVSSPNPADGGRGNVIAYNNSDGISVGGDNFDTGVSGVSIRGNTVYQNGGSTSTLGIDLANDGVTSNDNGNDDVDTGPNKLQNFPVIENVSYDSSTDVVSITYRVETATSNATYPLKIDIYAVDTQSSGEGKTYLGTQSYDSPFQSKTVSVDLGSFSNISESDYFVATATDANGNTSEFTSMSRQLPVELASFDATQNGDNTVELVWTTASETNNAGFRVQHRDSEDDTWTKLGYVESNASGGTTNEAQTYRFATEDLAMGTHQFRLRQVDLDGTTTVHDPVTVEVQMQEALQLAAPTPNPVQDRATLSFAVQEQADTRLTLYNTLGQRVRTVYRGTPPAGEAQTVRLSTTNLTSGVYFVRLQSGARTETRRVTVVR